MKRLLTALVLIPFFLYVVGFAPHWLFFAVVVALGLICFREYDLIARLHLGEGAPSFGPLGYAAGLFVLILPEQQMLFLTLAAMLALALSLRGSDLRTALPAAAALILGVVYVFGAWRAAIELRSLSVWWLLFATGVNWPGDTFAYYGGRAFGRRKLAPRISPNKTVEGTLCSLAGSAVLGWVFLHYLLPQVPLLQAVILCLAANAAGQIGDLAESAIKRGAGVKDSGNLLPGHGGWLDRVDSTLFSMPLVYWLISQRWFLP
jgi:phosphatidate cytidylyltransferase